MHRVYIDNGSSTDILYEHCIRKLPESWKKELKPVAGGPLVDFTGHSLWPLGTLHLTLMLASHDGRERERNKSNQILYNLSPSGTIYTVKASTLYELQAVPSTIMAQGQDQQSSLPMTRTDGRATRSWLWQIWLLPLRNAKKTTY